MKLSLDELRLYARCPLEWFWEKRARYARPRTTVDLMSEAMRAALDLYYRGRTRSLGEAMAMVWKDWCERWDEPTLPSKLAQYAAARASLLNQVPRMPNDTFQTLKRKQAYKSKMRVSGLQAMGQKLDEIARDHGIVVPDAKDRIGSALGDAFADCLVGVDSLRALPHPLPGRDRILGWQVPYQVELGSGMCLTGVADLAWRAEVSNRSVVLEVHDYQDLAWIRPRLVKHDLRVIAASLAQPTPESRDPSGQLLRWEHVDRVLFRHWPSGAVVKCNCETNVGYLHAVLISLARGLTSQVVVPRVLTGYDDCRTCAYLDRCWGEGSWEQMHLIDYGTTGFAERLCDVTIELRQAIAGDDQAVLRARQVLAIIEGALQERQFDLAGVRAILQEVRHTLEVIGNA